MAIISKRNLRWLQMNPDRQWLYWAKKSAAKKRTQRTLKRRIKRKLLKLEYDSIT